MEHFDLAVSDDALNWAPVYTRQSSGTGSGFDTFDIKDIPNQKGKQTSTPTLRWVFQIFEGILLLNIRAADKTKINIMNLKDEHITIIEAFGYDVKKMYFL